MTAFPAMRKEILRHTGQNHGQTTTRTTQAEFPTLVHTLLLSEQRMKLISEQFLMAVTFVCSTGFLLPVFVLVHYLVE